MIAAMQIAERILTQIEQAYTGRPAPRVRALHLPPLPWDGSKAGEFGAIELDSGAMGLSFILLGDAARRIGSWRGAHRGADALALAREWLGADAARRTIGYATAAALSRDLLDAAGIVPPDARDSIGGLDPRPGEHIGMVGYFPPLMKAITASGARLTVVELRADLVAAHPEVEITLDPAALRDCDRVLSTSTVLLNDTFDTILDHCAHAREIVVIGPGAGVLPDALFARGVTAIGGSWVEDRAGLVAALAAAAPWGGSTRKFLWRRDDWPGLPRR